MKILGWNGVSSNSQSNGSSWVLQNKHPTSIKCCVVTFHKPQMSQSIPIQPLMASHRGTINCIPRMFHLTGRVRQHEQQCQCGLWCWALRMKVIREAQCHGHAYPRHVTYGCMSLMAACPDTPKPLPCTTLLLSFTAFMLYYFFLVFCKSMTFRRCHGYAQQT